MQLRSRVQVQHIFLPCRVQSQVKRIARAMYSNPPAHGARIVANIVGNPSRFSAWKEEMREMAERIQKVRHELYSHLKSKDPGEKDWSFVLSQIGMFSYTGLSPSQVQFCFTTGRKLCPIQMGYR